MTFSYSVEKSQEMSHVGNPKDNYRATRGPLVRAAFQPGSPGPCPGKSH